MAHRMLADRVFGPAVSPCRRAFDFTLLFEEIVFTIIPSSLFIVCAAVRLFYLVKQSAKVKLGALHAFKLASAAVYSSLELAVLVQVCVRRNGATHASVPSAALAFIAATSVVILSHYEHTKSYRPSFLIALNLSVTALLGAARTRTYWLIEGKENLAKTSLAALVVQLVVISLESASKRNHIVDVIGVLSEELAGFMSRSLFIWLNQVMITGYRRLLTPADVRPIDVSLCSVRLKPKFDRILKETNCLTIRYLGYHSIAPVIPRICLTGFTFSQPFLVSSMLEYLEDRESRSINDGYGLIAACAFVYVGIAYWQLNYKAVIMVRGGLVDSIFEKILKLKEDKDLESKALTLMISDVQRIVSSGAYFHELWAALVETGIATWLLWRQVGPSSLAVLGLALGTLHFTKFKPRLAQRPHGEQRVWLSATERRIAATKKMLSSLKAIRMTGLGERVGATIEDLRTKEYAASKMFRVLLVGSALSSYTTLTLSPVLVFGAYIGSTQAQHGDLNVTRLFTSLILITLLASPLIHILQVITTMGAAKGCFDRIQAFLDIGERLDCRDFEDEQRYRLNPAPQSEKTPLKNANLSEKALEPADGEDPDRPILSVQSADIGWTSQSHLKNINLDVRKGEHVAITGPVGCGKSLLLKAILGESELLQGAIRICTAKIGYCGQDPWLENLSARQNAFRCAPVDNEWRGAVIDACALEDILCIDVSEKNVGSGGAKISGGQKQRLALARTIAFRPDIVLLDDVLSALDRRTQKRISERLFGPRGIFRRLGITVIFTTQDQNAAAMADKTYNFDESGNLHQGGFGSGAITEEGSETSGTDDHASTHITDKAVYKAYFGSIGPVSLALFFVGGISFGFTLRFPDIWVQWWSNDSNGSSSRSTGYWIGIYTLLEILPLIVMCFWLGHLLLRIVPSSGGTLHLRLLQAVLRASFAFISGVDTGNLMNRFNQDLMLVVLIMVAAAYVLSVLPVLIATLYLIQHFYLKTSKQLRHLDLQSKSCLHTKFSETCAGLVTIRAHAWENVTRQEFAEKLDRSQEPFYLLYSVQRWLQLTLNLVVAALAVIVAGAGVGLRDKISPGAVGVAFLNATTLGETLTNFITAWTSLETSLGAIARIEAFARDTPVEHEAESPVQVQPEWPEHGSVEFDNVWASYNPDAENPVWALRGVSMKIQAGEKVAVCGRSGCGKSTLLLSLLSIIETRRGSITIDGVDVSRVLHSVLRSRFQVISQNTFAHGESVRDCLDPEGKLSDEFMTDALADCAILDKVNTFGGLSGKISDANFSAGEAQLFSLARTILEGASGKNAIVLLDEATSSIDTSTEQRMMNVISKRLKGRTILSVLHRLEAALEYDKIAVLENGQVLHFGAPAEVVEKSELFAALMGQS
ncbi:putative ATP-binding cassette transporter [Westerdykella ornata]|uniref:Putative ATP-binding cassette transporter n=1 Tax=Westerdykella ornata TaxID=318751 RepID=A0A6A6JLF7_WESOR|nr:putative ATP-binding cassette transporter [Westerdykella ornata]KAF2277337.1 putative ATP-binding cassette transporter [Westerdykella ornata]